MNIKKYSSKNFFILLIFMAIICTCRVIYIKSEKDRETNNIVEKTMIDDSTKTETQKNIQTPRKNNDKVLSEIGKNRLIVNSYYGIYNPTNEGHGITSTGLGEEVRENWISVKPKKHYKIGVLLPHFEDKYWIAANYGIINYAKELGVEVELYTVGGYIEFGNQKKQLKALAKDNTIDGIIFASLDSTKFDSHIENIVNFKKPIVELINDINAPKISAKSIVSYYEMGYKAGESVIGDAGGKDIKIAFFPGPEGSGWAPDTFKGFKDAISKLQKNNQKIDISEPFYGDTRPTVQLLRIVSVLEKNNDYDYVVGCAPAVIQAEKFIEKDKEKFKNIKIVSTYITSEIYDLINKGTVLAAPSDQTIEQCRISLDMIVRILNGEKPGIDFPFQSGPEPPIISKDNISQFKYEDLFGKRDYIPVLNNMS